MNTRFRASVTVFVATILYTSVVYAGCNDRWCSEAKAQLLAGAILFSAGEFKLVAEPLVGKIYKNSGQNSKVLSARLEKGRTYAVFGVCDSDCADIDLKVYDDNGNIVASDTKTDDKPMVQVSPKWTANFNIQVIIHSCRAYRCTYGVGLFAKTATSEPKPEKQACSVMYEIYKRCYGQGIAASTDRCAKISSQIIRNPSTQIPSEMNTALGLLCGMACTEGSSDNGLPSYSQFSTQHCNQ